MVNIVPVDRARYGGKGWRRPNGYGFAGNLAVVPLGGSEFSQAIATMPIGFMQRAPGSYMPVAVVALTKGGNLFVGPGGQWMGSYVPAVLRSYPFSLIHTEGSEQGVLGIDEDSGLGVDDPSGEGVEKLFEENGILAATTKSVTELLHFVERDQSVTNSAVVALAEAGLIKPWPLTVQVGNQQVVVNGLHWIDEAALNALDDAAFLKLRKASSLVIAWASSFHGAGAWTCPPDAAAATNGPSGERGVGLVAGVTKLRGRWFARRDVMPPGGRLLVGTPDAPIPGRRDASA